MPLNNGSLLQLNPGTSVRLVGHGANRNFGTKMQVLYHDRASGNVRVLAVSQLGFGQVLSIPSHWLASVNQATGLPISGVGGSSFGGGSPMGQGGFGIGGTDNS